MDTIKRAIELLEERAQAFDGAKRELLDAYEAEHAGSKGKVRRGKKVALSSVGTPEDYVSNGVELDRAEHLWGIIEAKRLAPADSVILPHRYHYERPVAGRDGGICAPDGTQIACDVEMPGGRADFVVFDRKHTIEQVAQGDYDFRVRYERHDVDAAGFQRFAELAGDLLPDALVQFERCLLAESAGDEIEDAWCVNGGRVPVLLTRLVETDPGAVTFVVHLPWSEGRRDLVRIEFAPGCLGKADEPGEYNEHALRERAKCDFAGRIALHAFSTGAPASVPRGLIDELCGRLATRDEFERLCDLVLASLIGMRDDGAAYEDWCVGSKGRKYAFGCAGEQVAMNLLLVASVLEAQAGFAAADDFEAMREAFLARFDLFVAFGFGKSDDSLIKCVKSMEVTA